MQNKPNFPDAQMDVNYFDTKDYENKSNTTLGENKPNSNPIASEAKMSTNVYFTRNYDNNPALRPPKNKANSKPISKNPKNERKLIANKGLSEPALRTVPENKPKQSQSSTIVDRSIVRVAPGCIGKGPTCPVAKLGLLM